MTATSMPPAMPASTAAQERARRLEGYLTHDPNNLSLLSDAADAYLQVGDLAAAKRLTEHARTLAPDDGPLQYRLAVIEHRSGEPERALALLQPLVQTMLARGARELPVQLELARVQASLSNWPAVADALSPWLVDPQKTDWAALGEMAPAMCFLQMRALHMQGDVDAAIAVGELLAQSQGITPAELPPELAAAMGSLYLDASRADDARRIFEAAPAEGRGSEMQAVGGYVALQDSDISMAKALFEDSARQMPRNGRAHLGLGLALAVEGNLAQAKSALQQATQSMPSHLGSWHALAWLHLLSQDLDAAQQAFESALAQDRNFGETFGGLAVVAALKGERQQADEHVRTAAKLDKRGSNLGVAVVLLRSGARSLNDAVVRDALPGFMSQALGGAADKQALFAQLLRVARTGAGEPTR